MFARCSLILLTLFIGTNVHSGMNFGGDEGMLSEWPLESMEDAKAFGEKYKHSERIARLLRRKRDKIVSELVYVGDLEGKGKDMVEQLTYLNHALHTMEVSLYHDDEGMYGSSFYVGVVPLR